MDALPTTRKLDIIKILKQDLSLPTKNFFVKNNTSIRLCYFKHTHSGKAIKYINLSSVQEVAEFLKNKGVIISYECADGQVQMIRQRIITPQGKGAFTQLTQPVVYTWAEVSMTPGEVLHYAAEHEYQQTGGQLGMLFQHIFGKKKNSRAA